MEKAISQILDHIAKLYDNYEQKAAAMSEEQRKKMGGEINKQ